jgi:hypothetical protein
MYYFKKPMLDFMYDVLYDEYFSFGLRRRILEKILDTKGVMNQDAINRLNRLNTIRNYFAHCFNKMSLDGKNEFIPDPRNKGKPIDFEELYKEFLDDEKIVLRFLGDVYKIFGGPILAEKPKK